MKFYPKALGIALVFSLAVVAIMATPAPLILLTARAAASDSPAAKKRIRFLAPAAPYAKRFSDELQRIVTEYNRQNSPGGDFPAVELIRQGSGFSGLKEWIVGAYAGDPPEICAIESHELSAIEPFTQSLGAPQSVSPARVKQLIPSASEALIRQSQGKSLPFLRFVPVVLVDEEYFFRNRIRIEKPPTSWKAFEALATGLPAKPALTLPLEGPRGLWLLESLTGLNGEEKDWRAGLEYLREKNFGLAPPLLTRTWQEAAQDFLGRKTPVLLAATDILPSIGAQAAFRWKALPAPALPSSSPVAEAAPRSAAPGAFGVQLVLTGETPAIRKFLNHLYSPEIAARWTLAAGGVPLSPRWKDSGTWRRSTGKMGEAEMSYGRFLESASSSADVRQGGKDAVPLRNRWTQSLHEGLTIPAKFEK